MRESNKNKVNESSVVIIGQHGGMFGEEGFCASDNCTTSISDAIIEHVVKLSRYEDRVKEIHWSCDNDKTHVLCDELRDKIVEYQDTLVELYSGHCSTKVNIGVLDSCENITATTLPDLCAALFHDICNLLQFIKEDVSWGGTERKMKEMNGYLETVLYKETQK